MDFISVENIASVVVILGAILGAWIRGEFRSKLNEERVDRNSSVLREIHDKVDDLQQDVSYIKGHLDNDVNDIHHHDD